MTLERDDGNSGPTSYCGERGRGRPPLAERMSTLDEFSSGPGTWTHEVGVAA